MKISNWDIRQAFRRAIENVASIPVNQAWENISFNPIEGESWIRETFLPGSKRLSANKELSGVGIMQFDLFWPVGSGTKEVENVATDIEEYFEPARVIENLVRVDACSALNGRKDPGGAWYHIPVRIEYTVFSIT